MWGLVRSKVQKDVQGSRISWRTRSLASNPPAATCSHRERRAQTSAWLGASNKEEPLRNTDTDRQTDTNTNTCLYTYTSYTHTLSIYVYIYTCYYMYACRFKGCYQRAATTPFKVGIMAVQLIASPKTTHEPPVLVSAESSRVPLDRFKRTAYCRGLNSYISNGPIFIVNIVIVSDISNKPQMILVTFYASTVYEAASSHLPNLDIHK